MGGSRLALVVVLVAAIGLTATGAEEQSFLFRGVKYLHRWSKGTQHEFTPEKQEDLDHFTDMITLNRYPDVADGDGLAAAANTVLENYKSHEGKILKTNSVPRTADRPAEHFVAVMFTRPQFVELAFAHFKLSENKGHSIVSTARRQVNRQTPGWPRTATKLKRH